MADQTFNPNLNFYQSANAEPDVIKNDFIIRLREYEIIMGDIRRNEMKGSVQHYLLLGRRGSGKSTLLKRLQIEIDTDEELKQKYIAINLAEEQANIYRLFDLWEAIREELEHKHIEVEETEWDNDSNAYSRSLFAAIQTAIEKSGKKIILLLDNIDRIFENLKEDASLLREVLLNFDDIKIIGGSTRMTEHFWRYDMPFYEFFRVLKLEPLTSDEIKTLFLHWGEKYNLPVLKEFVEKRTGQLEAVRILTDGLPRTLLLFVNILVNKVDGTGYEYMKLIMDRVTPLYQERLNNLPPAQRKIVLQLAFLWEGVGAREVADAAHMDIKPVSAQLSQLADSGIVDKLSTSNKNNLYRLSERFFNLWLIFTQGSPKEKRKAKYLTIFLESFYDGDELKKLVENHLAHLEKMEPGKAVLLTKAFAQLKIISSETRDLLINKTNELKLDAYLFIELPLTTEKIIKDIIELIEKKSWVKALKLAEEIDQEDGLRDNVIGWINDKRGNYDAAEKWFLKAIEKDYLKAKFNIAVIYENHLHRVDLAEKYYISAIEKGETDSLNNLAVLYQKQNKIDLAEKYFLLAIEQNDIKAINSLAAIYLIQGKLNLAENYLMLGSDKGSKDAVFNLATFYHNQYRFDLAEKYYLIAIDNGDKIALFNLATIYSVQLKYDLAEKYYLLAIDSGIEEAISNLANLYNIQNNLLLAEKYLLTLINKVDSKKVNRINALYNLATIYYRTATKKEDALNYITQAYLLDNNQNFRTIYIAIKAWNGLIDGIKDELKLIFLGGDYTFVDSMLINILIHHQTNIVYQLFNDPDYGDELKERYQPIHFATVILSGKENNISLKIPPELQEIVNEILNSIEIGQAIFYWPRKK